MTNTPEPGTDPLDEYGLTANNGKHYTLPERPVWRDGPPPSIGWWPASASQEKCVIDIRWWNGVEWSLFAQPWDTEAEAASVADIRHSVPYQQRIVWTDRWWLS